MITVIALFYSFAVMWAWLLYWVLMLGNEPQMVTVPNTAIQLPPAFFVTVLLVGYVIVQERLLKARRRARSWVTDPTDWVTTWGSLVIWALSIFVLLNGGKTLPSLSVTQLMLIGFGAYLLYDAGPNMFLGKRMDDLLAAASVSPPPAGAVVAAPATPAAIATPTTPVQGDGMPWWAVLLLLAIALLVAFFLFGGKVPTSIGTDRFSTDCSSKSKFLGLEDNRLKLEIVTNCS